MALLLKADLALYQVLRLAPGGGVLLVVVEVVTSFFRKKLGPPYLAV